MKKLFPLILVVASLLFVSVSYAQKNDGEGSIFYCEVEQTPEYNYKVYVDLFTLDRGVQFIEIDLLDENRDKLYSNMAYLSVREGKLYITYDEKEQAVEKENIHLILKNTLGKINYPAINVKLLDKNLSIVDNMQQEFYE